MQICFATNNLHKLKEVQHLLGRGFQLITLKELGCKEELPEEQDTLEGNSLQKANYVYTHYHVPCFADDSGLEVEALKGAPGVHSAYYAGPQRNADQNVNLLLKNLRGVQQREARFRTIITYCSDKGTHSFEGKIPGVITEEKKGVDGFGYDPVFLPDGYMQTFAEMDLIQKNEISHRAKAVVQLVNFLKKKETTTV